MVHGLKSKVFQWIREANEAILARNGGRDMDLGLGALNDISADHLMATKARLK
jgi:hypothetical protein